MWCHKWCASKFCLRFDIISDIHINDLPLEVVSPVSLFTVDSKIFMRIISENNVNGQVNVNGKELLQKDLNNIKNLGHKLENGV